MTMLEKRVMLTTTMKKLAFERQSLLLFVLSMLGNGINYLFQIISGRLLSYESYGILNSAYSVINIIVVLGSAVALGVAKFTAEYNADNRTREIGKLMSNIFRVFCYISLGCCILFAIVTRLYLFSDITITISVVLCAFVGCITFIPYGALQGIKQFFSLGIYNLIVPLTRLILGSVLLWLGFEFYGVLGALFLGSLLSMLYAFTILSKKSIDLSFEKSTDVIPLFKFCIYSLLITFIITVYTNVDILLVKYYFNASDAGIYSSAALFSKMLLYLPAAFVTVMFPTLVENRGSYQKGKKLFLKVLLYSFGVSVVSALALFLLKDWLIIFIMGEKYRPALPYVLPTSIMAISLALFPLISNYILAQGNKRLFIIFGVSALALVGVMTWLLHQSVEQMIYVLTGIYLIFVIVNLVVIFLDRKKEPLQINAV